MATNPNLLDLNGEQFQDEMLRELPSRYTYLDGLETVFEQNWFELGAFRPHRFLPALSVSLNDQEGYVIPHGTVVSSENLKAGQAANWNSNAGIDTSGYFYTGTGFSGSMKSNVASIYGYDRTIDGVLIPANGTNASVSDYITASDVEIKRMKASGAVASNADVNSTVALTRAANARPFGVMVHQVMRETQGANLSYGLSTAALSVSKYGVLNIPYVVADASRINAPNKQPGGDTGYIATYWRHQFLLVTDTALMGSEVAVRVDGNGKLILTSDSTTYPRTFGKIISWTNETFPELNAFTDGFPGLEVPGTNTGGTSRRLFDFVKRIREAQGQSAKPADVIADLDAGYYGMVKILYNLTVV